MVRVSSCCCGCSLKTGTILIGVFYLVFYILSVIVIIIGLVAVSDKNFQNEILKDQRIDAHIKDSADTIFTVSQVILGIVLAIVIIGALLSVMLIVGAVNENARLVHIWFVIHTILLIIDTVLIITNGIAGATNSGSRGGSIAPTIITILLTIYFLIVVYSYYKELQEKGGPRTPGQPPSFQIEGYPMPPPNAPPAY